MKKLDLNEYTPLFMVVTNGSGVLFAATPDGTQLAAVGDLHLYDEDDPAPFVELARAAHSKLNSEM